MFAAIERTIGDGSSASVSYVDFRLDQHIARKAVSPSLKLLDHLGLIEIEPGPRLVNVFRFSNRWRSIDEVEAVRLAALAREVKPHRTFAKSPGVEAGEATEAEAHDGRSPHDRPAAALEKAGGRYAAGLLLQLPAPGVRFHCRFLMQSEGEALAGFGFPEQESRAERGRLRCHKRPKSREETPKEGSDSASGGQGSLPHTPI